MSEEPEDKIIYSINEDGIGEIRFAKEEE